MAVSRFCLFVASPISPIFGLTQERGSPSEGCFFSFQAFTGIRTGKAALMPVKTGLRTATPPLDLKPSGSVMHAFFILTDCVFKPYHIDNKVDKFCRAGF